MAVGRVVVRFEMNIEWIMTLGEGDMETLLLIRVVMKDSSIRDITRGKDVIKCLNSNNQLYRVKRGSEGMILMEKTDTTNVPLPYGGGGSWMIFIICIHRYLYAAVFNRTIV